MKEEIEITDQYPVLKKIDLEPIYGRSNQRIFSTAKHNKKIAFRKCKWTNSQGTYRYAKFSVNTKTKPDLVILTVESKNIYIFPLYNPYVHKQNIPEYKLKPYQNRFDYIESDTKDIPKIKRGYGQSPYRGVTGEKGWHYASIIVNKECIRLGRYSSAYQAAEVYDKAALFFCPPNLKTNKIGYKPFDERELAELIRNPYPDKKSKRTSNYRGVRKRGKKWSACIYIGSKQICLGTFENEKDAAMAYNEAAVKLNKKNAVLNKMKKFMIS